MKKIILIFSILSIITAGSLSAQTYSIKDRRNFKLGYSAFKEKQPHHSYMPSLRFESNYGINRFIEAGAYIGIAGFNNSLYDDFDIRFMTHYGINANFHVLPFFLNKDDFRFELYVTTKIGGNYCNTDVVHFRHKKNLIEYGIGIGSIFYISKKFGFFAEYCYGNFDYTDYHFAISPTKLRYGLTMKFK